MTYMKKITFESRGFRDVYWCWNLNEPFIISYRDENEVRKPFCENCNSILLRALDDEENYSKNDFVDHPFICFIHKPHWHKSWDGVGSVTEDDVKERLFNDGKPHECHKLAIFNGEKDNISICSICSLPVDQPKEKPQ